MVKHQRRSHQKGMHLSELDDCSSESDSGESPTTPTRAASWTPYSQIPSALPGHSLHRPTPFSADFGPHIDEYGAQAQYGNRHSISAGDSHEYQESSVPEQHRSIQILNRMQIQPNTYYVTEQSNPAVATMNTTPLQQYHAGPPQPERSPQDIPCSTTNLNGPIQSVSSPYSPPATVRGPSSQGGYYLPNQPPQVIEHQQQQIMAHIRQQMQQSMHPLSQISTVQPVHGTQEQFQQQASHHTDSWYNEMPYQAPIEVATIGQIPTFGSVMFDGWEYKPEDDPTMPMPSARIDSM
ncbi:hypothetical protein GQX73_g2155 [Xylaria multiplex]|uniref:Uncharacterized protein n=1 Tax=Xylaria multiplex TaxID=323545 RepID=A0A7C8MWX5_9PEZI|nr:hypothetical protein GQX73_g2155 [Xylaria multiplex]